MVEVKWLEKVEVRDTYKEMMAEEWSKFRNARLLSVEEEWKRFKETSMMIAARVCGYKSVGRKNI